MDFAANKIGLGGTGGDFGGGLAHAKADFQNTRRVAAKGGVQLQRLRRIRNHKARPKFSQRAFLAGGKMALAQHKAADAAHVMRIIHKDLESQISKATANGGRFTKHNGGFFILRRSDH